MDYALGLRALIAESDCETRFTLRGQELQQDSETLLLFDAGNHPRIQLDHKLPADARTHDSRPGEKRPRTEAQSSDNERLIGKVRGRPRANHKDVTAADRRRTQIRVAQRAYLQRKESVILSLKEEVQILRGTNQEMSNILISLYGSLVGKGLLRSDPEFGQQLRLVIERLLVLANASTNDVQGEEGDGTKYDDVELNRHINSHKAFPKKHREEIAPVSQPPVTSAASTHSRNVLSTTGSSDMHMAYGLGHKYERNQHEEEQHGTRQRNSRTRKRLTEDSAGPPSDLLDLQQFPMEVLQAQDPSHTFLSRSQMPRLNNNAHKYSFAQRIQRGAIETSFKIITSTNPSMEQRVQQVFGLSLLHKSKETIKARLQMLIDSSTWDSIYEWRAPFMSGTDAYYPVYQNNVNREPGFQSRTTYSMSPFSPAVTQTQEALEFNGDFLVPDDVEEYLRGRGLDILPAAEFITVDLNFLGISEVPLQKSSMSNNTTSIIAPSGPGDLNGSAPTNTRKQPNAFSLDSIAYDNGLMNIQPLGFHSAYNDWDSNSSLTASNDSVSSTFYTKPGRNARSDLAEVGSSAGRFGNRRIATISINTLLDKILEMTVCLGGVAGFKPADVDAALIAAVHAAY